VKLTPTEVGPSFSRKDLLRWLYLGRVALASGIFLGAVLVWGRVRPDQTLVATVLLVSALVLTGVSLWWTLVLEREPGENFCYAQIVFDVLLVTGVVHVTGGGESVFAPVYILVVTVGALLLPLRGGVLVGGLASILYFADTVWLHAETLSGSVGLQMGLFTLVALITGFVGDRLRRAGVALGEVESELRQLRLDTSDILGNVKTGVLTVDGTGRLAYLNAAAEELLGLDGDQWAGAPVTEALDSVAPGLGALIERTMRERAPLSRSKAIARRNGRTLTLGVSTTILEREEPGAPPPVTALFQDITDAERLEALNRRNERLEAVAELSASLAHEIKNPLASIRSAVEQLTQSGLDDQDRSTLRGLVVKESDRLSRLLSEFIEYSAVRMGRTQAVDLAALVREAVDLVRQHPEAEGEVEIRCEGTDGSLTVPGDEDLLHRAVFNLVLNAVQFSAPGGAVRVAVRECGEAAGPGGVEIPSPVRLAVRDSGPGIDREDLDRIFDPFFTTRKGGSGLGLSMVHRAVEAHRGAVIVESPDGGGSEFVIYLPGERAGESTEEA